MNPQNIRSVNGTVICRPFGYRPPSETAPVEEKPAAPKKGLGFIDQKFELAPLEVLFGTVDKLSFAQQSFLLVKTGDTVLVRADHIAGSYAKQKLYIPGLKDPNDPAKDLVFILVPLTDIVAVSDGCGCGDAATPVGVPGLGTFPSS